MLFGRILRIVRRYCRNIRKDPAYRGGGGSRRGRLRFYTTSSPVPLMLHALWQCHPRRVLHKLFCTITKNVLDIISVFVIHHLVPDRLVLQ